MCQALRLPGSNISNPKRRRFIDRNKELDPMYSVKTLAIATVFASALSAAPVVLADQALAQAKGCMACHQLETKVVGPAYKDVAAKYKTEAGAADMLAAKIKNGGVGTWGEIPMPPQPTLTDEETNKLAAWILSL
jgi:cytochrome c